jgi:hypothetical protein
MDNFVFLHANAKQKQKKNLLISKVANNFQKILQNGKKYLD